ncbi:L,D-transpeptidase family protein [Thauera sp. Sel9]|uniref:L,D-transpeptidase family protein n=1 Tax=Thauera sp. Sel9 TaxID=2974299 RepID=UPI0021E14F75|nr:L,D-transpeptidase family protein [Thauera sp. Sel9]MCV2216569.1 L,D-transpeptidase family protein [Thauera sp. Sel9]
MLPELLIDWRKSFASAGTALALAMTCPQPALALGTGPVDETVVEGSADGEVVPEAVVDLPGLIENRLAVSMRAADDVTVLFYRQRGFLPAWTRPELLQGLVEAVEALDEHGLDPADFAPDTLRTEALRPQQELSPDGVAERELLFTDTLARLVQQLRHGKVDPRRLYRDWNFSRPAAPGEQAGRLARLLDMPDGGDVPGSGQAAERSGLAAAVLAQAPDFELYRQLQLALKQYRSIAAETGDWPKVSAGPTLRPGERGARVVEVRTRLVAEGETELAWSADAALFDPALAEAVKRFQQRAGLAPDAAIGRQTVEALNLGPAQRVAQVRVNLERLRWVAQDMQGDHLLVDLTGYQARLQRGGQLAWSSRVIIGKPARETPALLDSVQYLVLNPKWVVPPTILREDLIPGVIRDPDYLAKRRMRVVDHAGEELDAQQIDWEAARRHGFPYLVEQNPGADGSLGRIKFALANPYLIYLHDTNTRALFRRDTRALSSGCVRVEKPLELATLLLDDAQRWSPEALEEALATGKTRTVTVRRKLPVLLHYATAALDDDGRMQFRPDIYARDTVVLAALRGTVR